MQSKKKRRSRYQFIFDFANGYFDPTPRLVNPKDSWSKKLIDERLNDTSRIPSARAKLKELLDRIIEEQRLTDSEELRYFTGIREKFIPQYEIENGKLKIHYAINRDTPITVLFYPYWLKDLSFTLIDFISDPDTDLRRVKKCEKCKDYYLAEQLRDIQKFCSKKCKRRSHYSPEKWAEYMRDWRANKKKEVESQKKEETEKEIQRRMKSAGMTRDEVVDQMSEDGDL
jgi:hypothetical protein